MSGRMFDGIDSNHDGSVSRDEFLSAYMADFSAHKNMQEPTTVPGTPIGSGVIPQSAVLPGASPMGSMRYGQFTGPPPASVEAFGFNPQAPTYGQPPLTAPAQLARPGTPPASITTLPPAAFNPFASSLGQAWPGPPPSCQGHPQQVALIPPPTALGANPFASIKAESIFQGPPPQSLPVLAPTGRIVNPFATMQTSQGFLPASAPAGAPAAPPTIPLEQAFAAPLPTNGCGAFAGPIPSQPPVDLGSNPFLTPMGMASVITPPAPMLQVPFPAQAPPRTGSFRMPPAPGSINLAPNANPQMFAMTPAATMSYMAPPPGAASLSLPPNSGIGPVMQEAPPAGMTMPMASMPCMAPPPAGAFASYSPASGMGLGMQEAPPMGNMMMGSTPCIAPPPGSAFASMPPTSGMQFRLQEAPQGMPPVVPSSMLPTWEPPPWVPNESTPPPPPLNAPEQSYGLIRNDCGYGTARAEAFAPDRADGSWGFGEEYTQGDAEEQAAAAKQAARLFDELDRNRDGKLTRAEFERLTPNMQRQIAELMRHRGYRDGYNQGNMDQDPEPDCYLM